MIFTVLFCPEDLELLLNLSNFALKGGAGEVVISVANFLTKYHALSRPLGAICISPTIIALLLGKQKATVTIGEDKETALEILKTGAIHKNCPVDNIVIDEKLKIVSTPAYMYGDARLRDIAVGIDRCVCQVLEWI